MLSNSKICFNVFSIRTYDELLCNWKTIRKLLRERLALTFQFVVSKLQKLLQNVMQTHLDQFAEFGPLPLNVCVTSEPQHKLLKSDTKCNKQKQTHKLNVETNF